MKMAMKDLDAYLRNPSARTGLYINPAARAQPCIDISSFLQYAKLCQQWKVDDDRRSYK
jgi:hypothetical protein